jgi:hypothetical protein
MLEYVPSMVVTQHSGDGKAISLPIPVNRVINRESNQHLPLWNEATTPYLSKNADFNRFSTEIKENLSGNFRTETGK